MHVHEYEPGKNECQRKSERCSEEAVEYETLANMHRSVRYASCVCACMLRRPYAVCSMTIGLYSKTVWEKWEPNMEHHVELCHLGMCACVCACESVPDLCWALPVSAAKKGRQHSDFPGGHPPEYYPSLRLLNFAERTGYGVLSLRWPSTNVYDWQAKPSFPQRCPGYSQKRNFLPELVRAGGAMLQKVQPAPYSSQKLRDKKNCVFGKVQDCAVIYHRTITHIPQAPPSTPHPLFRSNNPCTPDLQALSEHVHGVYTHLQLSSPGSPYRFRKAYDGFVEARQIASQRDELSHIINHTLPL